MTLSQTVRSASLEEIRKINQEVAVMRYEMHQAEDDGKYFFMGIDIDSLPYEELKEEYQNMRNCL